MKIAAVQMDIAWEERKSNFAKVSVYAEEAAAAEADLLILPEMFATGFSMNTAVTAESPDGETATYLRNLARRFNIGVVGGLIIRTPGEQARNCALIVDRSGNDLALYTKTYLFSHMGENKHHQPGTGPVTFQFDDIRCACFICYDLRFPEVFRQVCKTVEAAFVIASWPKARSRHWEILLPARAVENQFYMVGVNRVGNGDGLDFNGDSMFIDPMGTIESRLEAREGLLYGDIYRDKVQSIRETLPFINDYRERNVPRPIPSY